MAFWLRRLCFNLCRKGPYAKALCSSSILGPTQGSRFLENDLPMFSVFNPAVTVSRHFSSRTDLNNVEGPVAFDYSSILSEAEFHGLADETLHNVQEKLEECGDDIQIDGFDMDYASGVLTLKLGNLGTYVINKQTPNRQIWLSSPVSCPEPIMNQSVHCNFYDLEDKLIPSLDGLIIVSGLGDTSVEVC